MRSPRYSIKVPHSPRARHLIIAALVCVIVLPNPLGAATTARAAPDKERIAYYLATLLRSARAVVSDNQFLINNPSIGDKGFTGSFVVEEAKFNFRMGTGFDLDALDPTSLEGELLLAEFEAIAEVVDEAQPLINRKGKGFKGFLPATFARRVAQKFSKKKGDKAEIKVTAPKDLLRNTKSVPDIWEHSVIEQRFRSEKHPIGRAVATTDVRNGKPAFRLMLPEYYMISCLACHGHPKGEVDKTGGRKEGGVLGELGGAISVVLYGPR